MKKMLIALLASSALLAPALAADLPAKAPRLAAPLPAPCSVAGCVGWHLDLVVANSGTGVNAFNLAQAAANGASLGVGGGYQWYNGSYWLGVRADVGYTVINGDNFGISNLTGHQMVELGGNAFAFFGLAPPQTNGVLSAITSAVPTADVGICERGKANGFCTGATLHWFLPTTPIELKAGYINANYGTTKVQDGTNVTTDNIVWFGASYHL